MTLGTWLAGRTPPPPQRLGQRIREALGDRLHDRAERAPELCSDAATALLHELLSRPTAGRESALELLTVDALVTYAFEAAAANPASLAEHATTAMARLSLAAQ